ncbi:hypothetical protein [Escherichia phage BEK6]|nr:hypothetical protein [Escherichia phage BEK6]
MIDAKLSTSMVAGEPFYTLEVFKDGELIHIEGFFDIYKAKSAQRKWWRN